MSPKLFIIDAYGFVFRAYYSLSSMTTANNQPIGALFGFCNMIIKILKTFSPEHLLIIYDSGQKNFRHALNENYKINRDAAPAELVSQFQLIRDFVTHMGIPNWEAIGFEADDLIATIAKITAQTDWETIIISSDKDLTQLIHSGLIMFDPVKDKEIDAQAVFEKFGVYPEKILDFLTLMGDKSDNIEGVRGVGPKNAAKLLAEFGSLDKILENISSISSKKIAQNLTESQSYIHNSRELVRLANNVPLPHKDLHAWSKMQEPDFKELFVFLRQYNFTSIINKIENLYQKNSKDFQPKIEHKQTNVINKEELETLCAKLQQTLKIFINIGTENINISIKDHEIFTIIYSNEISQHSVLKLLHPILENPAILKIFFDSKASIKTLQKHDIDVAHAYDDLCAMFYSLSCGQFMSSVENIKKRYAPQSDLPCHFHIFEIYEGLLHDLQKLKTLEIYVIEKKICAILAQMELQGVAIDSVALDKLSIEFTKKSNILEGEIFAFAGEKFNIGSPKQIGKILFEKLQIPHGKKTKSGIYATDSDALQQLKEHAIAAKILQWRHFEKLNNTYVQGLHGYASENGKIHTNYSNLVTITGRLTSNKPNLQNLPIKSKDGQLIRAAFVAEEGKNLISADYSQIELRVLAHIAGVEKLQQAFANGFDIHSLTAMEIFDLQDIAEVNADLRRKAKSINFGIIYGLSSFGLAKQIDISIEEAKKYIEKYFEKYPEIRDYMEKTMQFARENNFVTTVLNRRCYVKDVNSVNHNLRSAAERSAINAPIQGTAADIVKLAMIKIAKLLNPNHIKMIMQIHDELVFESDADSLDENLQIIKNAMENINLFKDLKLKIQLCHGSNFLH